MAAPRKIVWILLVLLLLGAVFFSARIRDPDWNCSTSSVDDVWSPNRSYKATLLMKNCNQYESIFYIVRLEYFAPPSAPIDRSWFVMHELENDDYPDEAPRLYWESSHRLVAETKTRGLAGTLTLRHTQDVTFIRKYFAKDSDQ